MQARFSMSEIEAAWPHGLRALFEMRGVRLVDPDATDPASIGFREPCRWHWDRDGDLVVEQP